MGVDAEILIKITNPDSWLSEDELRQYSSKMTATIGVDSFFLRPGINRHALSFYEEHEYYQDGPSIFRQDNEQFIEVHLASRYYGEDYPRGYWPSICFTLLWIKANLRDAEVWYGGDSSGICMELITEERLKQLNNYYLTTGTEEYWMNEKQSLICDFCQTGVTIAGGGGAQPGRLSRKFVDCGSCGKQWVLRSDNMICAWGDKAGDPYTDPMASFTMSDEIENGAREVYPFDGTFYQSYLPKKLKA